ncbi:hypothetical protein [Enterococcus avium]|uniref:hypothetical protein n=1 Tax=Enterococcus avium TaxID=33945 RepID=UPI001F58CB47|nr:hypothetical protein [Enterococcus avium]
MGNFLIDASVIFFKDVSSKQPFFVSFPSFVEEKRVITFFERKDSFYIDILPGEIHLSRELISKCLKHQKDFLKFFGDYNICFYWNVVLFKVVFLNNSCEYTRYVLVSKFLSETQVIEQVFKLYSPIERIVDLYSLMIPCWK